MKDYQYLYSEFDATPVIRKEDYLNLAIGIIVVAGMIWWIF